MSIHFSVDDIIESQKIERKMFIGGGVVITAAVGLGVWNHITWTDFENSHNAARDELLNSEEFKTYLYNKATGYGIGINSIDTNTEVVELLRGNLDVQREVVGGFTQYHATGGITPEANLSYDIHMYFMNNYEGYDINVFHTNWFWENVQDAPSKAVDTLNSVTGIDPIQADTSFAAELGNFVTNIKTSMLGFAHEIQNTVSDVVHELPNTISNVAQELSQYAAKAACAAIDFVGNSGLTM